MFMIQKIYRFIMTLLKIFGNTVRFQWQESVTGVRHMGWLPPVGMFLFFMASDAGNYVGMAVPDEYQVKAVYLFNLSKFIRWPESVFDSPTASIRICVLGKNPFPEFDALVKDKKVDEHPVKVQYLRDFKEAGTCHILFVSQSEQGDQAAILAYLRQYPIFTVSDIENFAERGGMLQFYNSGNKVRLMVDPQTVKKAGMQASSRLLQVAKVVSR